MVRGGPEGTVYRVHYNRAHTETPRVAETVAARTGRNCACYFKTQPLSQPTLEGVAGWQRCNAGGASLRKSWTIERGKPGLPGRIDGTTNVGSGRIGGRGGTGAGKGLSSRGNGKWNSRKVPAFDTRPHAHTSRARSSVWIDNVPGCCLPYFSLFLLSPIPLRRLVRAHRGHWSNPESSVFHAETRVLPSVDQHPDELIARNSPTTCGPLSAQYPSPRW